MKTSILLIAVIFLLSPFNLKAEQTGFGVFQYSDEMLKTMDSDNDGLSDYDETYIYKTNPNLADTDSDGYTDGTEVLYNYDPNKNLDDKLEKTISVSLQDQSLTYALGPYVLKTIKISSGVPQMPTPPGEYKILKKLPTVNYGVKGGAYFYPNTRWNMLFKYQAKGNLYIHGAFWHNNFGTPMSHGCINVSYADVEALYNWADMGTKITIK